MNSETEATAHPEGSAKNTWAELNDMAVRAVVAHTGAGATHRGKTLPQRPVPPSSYNVLYRSTVTSSSWAAAPVEDDPSLKGRAATNDLSIASKSPMHRQFLRR